MNEDILFENIIQHCDQVNHPLDLVTPRPVISCEEKDNTPMNSTYRASRLSIHNSTTPWKSDFVTTPSCNVVDAIRKLKDDQNYLKKKPMMVKHQQGVSRSKVYVTPLVFSTWFSMVLLNRKIPMINKFC
jgi:hypothetical protein